MPKIVTIQPRKLSPGELSLNKRLAAYEAARAAKQRPGNKGRHNGITIIRPSRGAYGELITSWSPENDV